MSYNRNMISIISPVYNVNKYLKEFFDSFLVISDKIEIIIVDDRGQEDPKKIIDLYSKRLNIKYIKNKENIGLGFSRNVGLQHISKESTHVMYVDSDDKINDHNFINEIIKDKITWFNYVSFTKEKTFYEKRIESWGKNLFRTTIWGIAIPVKIAKELEFEHRFYEDTLINRRLAKYHGNDVILSKTPAIAYRFRSSGINSSKPNHKKYEDFLDSILKIQDEGINTYRFNMQEIYQYYWMWKKNLKGFDKRKLPKINFMYYSWFWFTGNAIRFLKLESLIYGRNKKNAFD